MKRWARLFFCLLAITCLTACSFWVESEGKHLSVLEKGDKQMLAYRLDVEVREVVTMQLQVKNTSDKPIKVNFRSSQEFDFVIEQRDKVVWRWSHDKSFAQMLMARTLQPGQELGAYQAKWSLQNLAGEKVEPGTYILKAYFLGVSKQIPVAQVELQIP